MNNQFQFAEFTIKGVDTGLEINYLVFDPRGYFCRLVPGEMGFELSKLDKALDNQPENNLVTKIADFIFQKNA